MGGVGGGGKGGGGVIYIHRIQEFLGVCIY